MAQVTKIYSTKNDITIYDLLLVDKLTALKAALTGKCPQNTNGSLVDIEAFLGSKMAGFIGPIFHFDALLAITISIPKKKEKAND